MSRSQTLLFLLLLLTSVSATGQDTLMSYFNSDWKECMKSEASYFRKTYPEKKNLWAVRDYFMSGELQMKGQYQDPDAKMEQGYFEWYFKSGVKSRACTYKNGQRDGIWTEYYRNGKLSQKREYVDGDRKSTENYDKDGSRIFDTVEKMPKYKGGLKGIFKHLNKHLTYPEKARNAGISGTVYTSFIVEKDGSVSNAKVLKGIGGGCDEEALRVINLMKKWKPGSQRGKKVRVQFNMPIKFTLR